MGVEFLCDHAFHGVYVWNLGGGRSLWILPERTLDRLQRFRWTLSGVPRYRTVPAGNRVFRMEGEAVGLTPCGITRFRTHPFFGAYVLVWVESVVSDLDADVPVFLK